MWPLSQSHTLLPDPSQTSETINLFRCNHPSEASHRGAAIYIRQSLNHHELPSYQTDQIQVACIVAKLHCGTSVTLAAVYNPLKHRITTSDYLKLFSHFGSKWIAGGD